MQQRGANLLARLIVKVNSLSLRLQAKIVGEKLSGQVLHIRTGKGAGSVRVVLAKLEGDTLSGGVEAGGGPAWYMILHEWGGTFQVAEYIRRRGLSAQGHVTKLLTKSGAIRKNVKDIKSGVVRAHSVTFPPRSFMRTSVAEFESTITAEIADVIAESMQA